jgi:hypothetical protein
MKVKSVKTNTNDMIDIGTLHEKHPKVRAADWRSPLIRRLIGSKEYSDGRKILNNSLRTTSQSIIEDNIELKWQNMREDFVKCINTYQEPVITEFATLGLACILLSLKTEYEITEVTRRGEKADYWIGDKESLIEISGQENGSLSELCEQKARQLLENPFQKSGYVCVANYSETKSRLWFYSEDCLE